MDWAFTEEQDQLAALVRQVLAGELDEERMRRIEASEDRFDKPLWDTLRTAGVLDGLGVVEQCRVFVELGRAVAPISVQAIVAADISGRAEGIVAPAVVDELDAPMRAERTGDGWTLNGTKTTVPAGTVADVYLVTASTEQGPMLFEVERGAPGVGVTSQVVTSTDKEAQLDLRDVPGTPIGYADAVEGLQRRLTVAICADQLGICERALELTAEYSKVRVQFDRPIATFQAVGQRLADAYIDVHGIRLTTWQAAWRLAEGLPADTEIATAKFWAADAGHRVAHTAVHVHGGMGIDLDYHLHRYFTAAKRNEFALGGATEQLVSIGRTLASEPA
jgi:alkylation response protein AidB-like acyl-CoA dehydrogenase